MIPDWYCRIVGYFRYLSQSGLYLIRLIADPSPEYHDYCQTTRLVFEAETHGLSSVLAQPTVLPEITQCTRLVTVLATYEFEVIVKTT